MSVTTPSSTPRDALGASKSTGHESLADLVVVVLGGGRPAMKHARDLLNQMVGSVRDVADVDEALLCLIAEVPDVLMIDGAQAKELRPELNARAVPALLADQIPVLWIGGGTGVIRALDRQLTEVVLDAPFSASDVRDALSAAMWVGSKDKVRGGPKSRPTTPLHMRPVRVGPAQGQNRPPPRRKTNPYEEVSIPLDGRPRRGSGSHSAEMRSLPTQSDSPRDTSPALPPRLHAPKPQTPSAPTRAANAPMALAPSAVMPHNGGIPRRPKISGRPLRAHDSPNAMRNGRPRRGALVDDRYRILGQLGQGGSAWVLRAMDLELGEEVALKLMRTDVNDEILRRRFRREMRVCRRLTHPNIVRTYEFGNWHGRMYYTMELLEGSDLSDLMLQRPARLSMSMALNLLAEACDALQSAHEVGIVHRDIKPQNLFVLRERQMKVTDFGVAKGTGDIGLTITHGNLVVGTPAYLAPERLEDKVDLSPTTDIYSMGASMYHVFTGRLPFKARDLATLLTSIVTKKPRPPRALNPMMPRALEDAILKAMARNPKERHSDSRELRDELRLIARALG